MTTVESRKTPSSGPNSQPKNAPQATWNTAVAATTGKITSRPSASKICEERAYAQSSVVATGANVGTMKADAK